MTIPTFDINAAIKALRYGKDPIGNNEILTLIKQLTEAALAAELDGHLARTKGRR